MSDNTKAILGALSDKCTCVYVDNGDGDPELLMYHCTQCHAAEWIEALEADRDKARAEVERLKAALVEQVKQYPDYSDICRKALEAKP